MSFTDYKLEFLKVGVNFRSDIELTNYVNKVLQEVSIIDDEIRREIILKKLAIETDLSYNTLEKRLSDYIRSSNEKAKEIRVPINSKKMTKIEKATNGFIYAMLLKKKAIIKYNESNLVLYNQQSRYLANEIAYYYQNYGSISIADFYTYLQDKKDLLDLYNKIISTEEMDDIDDKAIDDYILVINSYNKSQEIKRLEKLIRETFDDLEKSKIAEKIRQLKLEE